jgi:hypothetical protein
MADQVEWRRIYGRLTAFVGGLGVADAYPVRGSDPDVWRLRAWPRGRVQGGFECFVLNSGGEEAVKVALVELLERARQEAERA